MFHTHEVIGSSPIAPTTHNLRRQRHFQRQPRIEMHRRHAVYRGSDVRFGAFFLLSEKNRIAPNQMVRQAAATRSS